MRDTKRDSSYAFVADRTMEQRIADWWYWKKDYWVGRRAEKIAMWVAWHMPRTIAYWCYVRLVLNKLPDDRVPTSQLVIEPMKRWGIR